MVFQSIWREIPSYSYLLRSFFWCICEKNRCRYSVLCVDLDIHIDHVEQIKLTFCSKSEKYTKTALIIILLDSSLGWCHFIVKMRFDIIFCYRFLCTCHSLKSSLKKINLFCSFTTRGFEYYVHWIHKFIYNSIDFIYVAELFFLLLFWNSPLERIIFHLHLTTFQQTTADLSMQNT